MSASRTSNPPPSIVLRIESWFVAAWIAFAHPLTAHEQETQLPFQRLHAHGEIEGHAHLGWDSRYFSEGRDNLEGDSLLSSSLELGWNHLAAGVWYGRSPDQRYDEAHFSLALTQSVGDFDFYAGYTHLRFPLDGSHDHEAGAGCTWSGLPGEIELSLDSYYSFEATGLFTELGASRDFEITGKITLNAATIVGFNHGYVADGHDGTNHAALRIGLEYELTEAIAITAHAVSSWAIGRDKGLAGDDLLDDFVHGGIGVHWTF